jgi:hypothetical protein
LRPWKRCQVLTTVKHGVKVLTLSVYLFIFENVQYEAPKCLGFCAHYFKLSVSLFWFAFLIVINQTVTFQLFYSLYADVEARCQVYHTCLGKDTFQSQLNMENRTMKRKMFHSSSIFWTWQRKFLLSLVVIWNDRKTVHWCLSPIWTIAVGRFVPELWVPIFVTKGLLSSIKELGL